MILDRPASAMLKGLELHGRSFFLLRGSTDHLPFFLLIGSFAALSTSDQARSSTLQVSPQLLDMVKRKAEKQQSAGTKYMY